MPRRYLALATAILGGAIAAAAFGGNDGSPPGPDDGWAAIRQHVTAELERLKVPGASVTIVRDDEIVFAEGFGVADGSGRAVGPDTPFAIASVSKWVTSLAVMQLVDDGLVELDAPVDRYLPWFARAGAETAPITVLQLLTHTTGWTANDGLASWGDADGDAHAIARNAARLAKTPRHAEPGTFAYSNANYDVLGEIVEQVTGTPYDRYLNDSVFAPLGMDRSFTTWESARSAGMAVGHYLFFGEPVSYGIPFVRASLPSAFLASSADDLARLAIAALNDGRYDNVELISPASNALMQRPLVARGRHSAQAIGLRVEPLEPDPDEAGGSLRLVLRHGGDLVTFASDVVLIPAERAAVVVLMNANDPVAPQPYHQLSLDVARMAIGLDPAPRDEGEPLLALGKPLLLFVLLVQIAMATHPRHGLRTVQRAHDALPTVIAVATAGATAALIASTPSVPPLMAMRLAPDVAMAIGVIVALGIPPLQPRGLRRSLHRAADAVRHNLSGTQRWAPQH